ncbi:MAG: formate dehydrogenase accessory sulfurtransferase FdhD, partial [Nitrospinota bacterium]
MRDPLEREESSGIDAQALEVSQEVPVELSVNGHKATLLCTPTDLKALALGWLFTQGLIEGLEEVGSLAVCDDLRKIIARTERDLWEERGGLSQVLTSGCGGGSILGEVLTEVLPPVESDLTISAGKLRSLVRATLDRSLLYKERGGIHCASLADGQGVRFVAEDVGRHNALDKVIGMGLEAGADFSSMVITSTGRITSEMILKAARVGVPIVASLSIPSDLAVEIAESGGITLVGRAAGSRMRV